MLCACLVISFLSKYRLEVEKANGRNESSEEKEYNNMVQAQYPSKSSLVTLTYYHHRRKRSGFPFVFFLSKKDVFKLPPAYLSPCLVLVVRTVKKKVRPSSLFLFPVKKLAILAVGSK